MTEKTDQEWIIETFDKIWKEHVQNPKKRKDDVLKWLQPMTI